MIKLLLIVLTLSTQHQKAQCVKGLRGDPLFVVRGLDRDDNMRSYHLYYLPDQHEKCAFDAKRWNNRVTNNICACKQLKNLGIKDRIRLSCIVRKNSHVYLRRVAIYYYSNLYIQCIKKAQNLEKQWY